jgi:2-dehydro-3-deoxyphosphogalactonate aldolase
MVGLGGLKALVSVLPVGTDVWPVGGIAPHSMAAWAAAGATGFGIGSQLCSPGKSAQEVAAVAAQFVDAWQRIGAHTPRPA